MEMKIIVKEEKKNRNHESLIGKDNLLRIKKIPTAYHLGGDLKFVFFWGLH